MAPTASLGKNGPHVVRMGLGLMGLSGMYGHSIPESERLAFLDHAYEIGQTFWDSADIYGDSEDLIGKWFKANPNNRDKIFLATKFGHIITPDGIFVDSSPEYVKEACAASLKRLGIPAIDLYYAHRVDGKTPIEKTVAAMVELQLEGKIKYIGLSEVSAATLRRANKVHQITAVQVEYSPFALEIETMDLLNTCRDLGVAVVAYSPLGRGLFTGAIRSTDDFAEDDFRRSVPRFSKENFSNNLVLVDQLNAIAEQKRITPSQLVLAWLLAQGHDIFPIPGTSKISRLDENVKALEVELTREETQAIRQACEAADITGDRYPEALMSALFADTPQLKVEDF
ncbi:aldo-keto reductase, putative [Periconia macrospinosa]|uniref:Aldo-keto reductase, putative n=1 Tax=Periconia macrospinosa TaxID=97972 RepID=A0A2V1DJS4_9PLEO|nr:aldo-keto reductase, putative [Periconia macrospinosa]